MNRIRVHAAYVNPANPILCSSCAEWKETGRAYDLLVAIQVTDAPTIGGIITLCQGCRDDFHRADLELEAPEMEAEYQRRQNELDEMEHQSPFLHQSSHLTFPPDKR